MMHLPKSWCPTLGRKDAIGAVESARANLAEARVFRALSDITTNRLRESVERNHFREAVEFQLRGDQQ
jgi:hypothetical protein